MGVVRVNVIWFFFFFFIAKITIACWSISFIGWRAGALAAINFKHERK